MSSAFFNLGQSCCIRAASRLHPTVSILLISDDTHVLGQPGDDFAAIHTIRQQYADIGLLARMSSLALGTATPQRNTGLPPMQRSIGYLLTKGLRSKVHLWVAMLS